MDLIKALKEEGVVIKIQSDYLIVNGIEYGYDEVSKVFIEYTSEGDETGNEYHLEDLMEIKSFQEANECPDCGGKGGYEVDEPCMRPASSCCGGCTKMVACNCKDIPFQ